MRIAFRRSLQTYAQSEFGSSLPKCSTFINPRHRDHSFDRSSAPSVSPVTVQYSQLHRRSRETDETRTPSQSRERPTGSKLKKSHADGAYVKPRSLEHLLSLSANQRQSPSAWIQLLGDYLPPRLHGSDDEHETVSPVKRNIETREILEILFHAQRESNFGSDVLTHMIVHGHKKAALWICDRLLNNLDARYPQRLSQSPPSNILWPASSLEAITSTSISVDQVSYECRDPSNSWHERDCDPRYSFEFSDVKDSTMARIWHTLGSLVVRSANMSETQGQDAMNAAHLILGQIHKLDLVPQSVYDYHPSPFSASVQRPPIIHLVSSRILTALSDAAWREHQDEAIEKAASHGASYREIGRDPPGGRFRLKVSPMGAEVWLEFILWCCVEGGFATVGSRIVNTLRQETEDPWFAITWSAGRGTSYPLVQVDWNRVKSRSGGTVGRIEGYSRDKPLAEVPPRTISTEVVLALVESNIDTVRRAKDGKGKSLALVSRNITGAITFLEPHDLPVSYFDYITARLITAGCFERFDRAYHLNEWAERLSFIKSLSPVQEASLPRVSFGLGDITAHSEFGAGFTHQILQAHLSNGDVHQALMVFDRIQRLVDNSKLHAISAFLHQASHARHVLDSSNPLSGSYDFNKSHGQLPLYKLATLLNLATETKLVGFGHWLLHSKDPDGPLISPTSYRQSTIAHALVRFAGMSGDRELLQSIPTLGSASRRLETVNFLRASFNANVSLLDFQRASKVLEQLTRAKAGGFGLINLAHLAGTIVKLESENVQTRKSYRRPSQIQSAINLLHSMLASESKTRAGVFSRSVITTFRQQVSHLLSVFQATRGSSVASVAGMYSDQYPVSNIPNLPASVFNLYLDQVMEVENASHGMRLVETLCTHANDRLSSSLKSSEHAAIEDEFDLRFELPKDQGEATEGPSNVSTQNVTHAFIPFATDEPMHDSADQDRIPDYPAAEESDSETQEGTPFVSPFFGKVHGSSFVQHSPPFQNSPSSVDSTENAVAEPKHFTGPVCIIDTQMIRLVARSAVREKHERESRGVEAGIQRDILKWARQNFTALGLPQSSIMNEIAEPLEQADISTMEVNTTRSKQSLQKLQGMKFYRPSRISAIFRGENKVAAESRRTSED